MTSIFHLRLRKRSNIFYPKNYPNFRVTAHIKMIYTFFSDG